MPAAVPVLPGQSDRRGDARGLPAPGARTRVAPRLRRRVGRMLLGNLPRRDGSAARTAAGRGCRRARDVRTLRRLSQPVQALQRSWTALRLRGRRSVAAHRVPPVPYLSRMRSPGAHADGQHPRLAGRGARPRKPSPLPREVRGRRADTARGPRRRPFRRERSTCGSRSATTRHLPAGCSSSSTLPWCPEPTSRATRRAAIRAGGACGFRWWRASRIASRPRGASSRSSRRLASSRASTARGRAGQWFRKRREPIPGAPAATSCRGRLPEPLARPRSASWLRLQLRTLLCAWSSCSVRDLAALLLAHGWAARRSVILLPRKRPSRR